MNHSQNLTASNIELVKNLLRHMQQLVGPVGETPIILRSGSKVKVGLGMGQLATDIEEYIGAVNRNITNIVILGEFNRGKSTLLNSLLGRKYLPAYDTPTTAAITRIAYGDREKITVFYRNAAPQPISWEVFRKEFQLSTREMADPTLRERFKNINYIQIEIPHALLKQGLTFVDTPGLGEHWMRTQVTLKYLRQAHVVIFVLDAVKAMSLVERNVIKLIAEKYATRCFFVVNRINQIEPDDVLQVQEWVQTILRDSFTNAVGEFEEFYKNRVFWVDARAALLSRQNSNEDVALFEKSGVGAFESSLTRFLGMENRQAVVLESIVNNAIFLSALARQRLYALKNILSEPNQQATELLKVSKARLDLLKHDLEDLEALLSGFTEKIKYAIYADIINFISEMKSTWIQDSKQLVNESNIQTVWKLLSSERRQEFSKHLEDGIRTYLEDKLAVWSDQMPLSIAPAIEEVRAKVERKVHELAKGLKESEGLVHGTGATRSGTTDMLLFHLVEDLKLGDISSNIADAQSRYLTNNLKSIVANGVLVIASMFLGSSWIAILAGGMIGSTYLQNEIDDAEDYASKESADSSPLASKIQQRLLTRLGKQIFPSLRAEIVKKRDELFKQMDNSFDVLTKEVSGAFNAQIVSAQEDISRLETFLNSPEPVIQREVQRLELINIEITSSLKELLLLVQNRTMTEHDVDKMIDEFSLDGSLHEEYGDPLSKLLPKLTPIPNVPNSSNTTTTEIQSKLARQISERISSFISAPVNEKDELDKEVATISPELSRLVGLYSVKKWVVEWKYFIQEELKLRGATNKDFPSLHIAFTGNPGTGKTTVARLIGKIYKDLGLIKRGHIQEVGVNDLTSVYVGGTTKVALAQFQEALDGVLFIDEAYQLTTDGFNYRGEVVDLLIKYMEDHRDRLVVVVAGYPKEMETFLNSNPGLRRRFPQENIIEFPDYTSSELMSILLMILKEQGYTLSEMASEQIAQIVDGMYSTRKQGFGNAGTIRDFGLALRKKRNARVGTKKLPPDTPIDIDDIPQLFRNYAFSPAKKPDEILELLNEFIGMEKLKKQVNTWAKQLMYNKRQKIQNTNRSLHMVFRGNPGTGKTSVANVMGKILKSLGVLRSDSVTTTTATDLIAGFVGQSGGKTRKVIERALDGILFIDEAYGLTTIEQGNSDFGASVLQELIIAMEQHRDRLVVIFAGYSREMYQFLDSNPGLASRIPYQFDFPDYSADELMQIFEQLTKQEGYFLSEAAMSKVKNTISAMHYDRDRYFGNARNIRNLLNEIITQQNARALDLLDLPDGETLAKKIEIEDIPDYAVSNQSRHRNEAMSDVQIQIVRNSEPDPGHGQQRAVETPLRKLIVPNPAADRSH